MSDETKKEETKRTGRNKAETILKMTKDATRVKHHIGAEAVIIIGIFKEGNELQLQDAGFFPAGITPADFYSLMRAAHLNGQMGHNSPRLKPTSRIIKPH